MIWAFYLLFLAGSFAGCGVKLRLWWSGRQAARRVPLDVSNHERLP